MRIAIPIWNDHVSPVFDSAERLLVVEVDHDQKTACRSTILLEPNQARRAAQLSRLGIDQLLCGAVSRALEDLLNSSGVRVHGRIRGEVEDVLQAFLTDGLDDHRFCLPGCCSGHGNRQRSGKHGQPTRRSRK